MRRPRAQLRALLRALTAIYARAQAEHVVLLNHLGALPPERQAELRAGERALVARVAALLERLGAPAIAGTDGIKPLAMLLFGMINWTHTWYHPAGPLAPERLADLAAELLLTGLAAGAEGERLAG